MQNSQLSKSCGSHFPEWSFQPRLESETKNGIISSYAYTKLQGTFLDTTRKDGRRGLRSEEKETGKHGSDMGKRNYYEHQQHGLLKHTLIAVLQE